MKVHLSGELNWYDPQKRSRFEIFLPQPTLLKDVIEHLGIPPGEVYLVAINGEVASIEEDYVMDSDCVDFYPAIGGG